MTPLRRRPTSTRRAVTFLELMAAMLILGLLLAVTLPNMVSTGHLGHLRGAAREIVAMMRFARSTAVFGEIEVDLRFSPQEGLFTLSYDPVALEVNQSLRRRERDRGDVGVSSRTTEEIQRRNQQWLRVHALPTDNAGNPTVRFALVDTEATVTSDRDRHTQLPAVVFFPDGTASAATVVLESVRGGGRMSIDVLTATGVPVVTEGDSREARRAQEGAA